MVTTSLSPKPSGFLLSFWKILSDPKHKDIISWSPSGDSVVIHDSKALTEKVFPLYFKATLFNSFVRQLNM
jgi:hypothetical protein